MKVIGSQTMITDGLLAKWKDDLLKDNLLITYAIYYVYVLRKPEILETVKTSRNYRPWENITTPEEIAIWFPTNRCSNYEEKNMFEILLEFWHNILIMDGHLEVLYNNKDGLGLYSKVNGLDIKYLSDKKATFLFEINSKKELNELVKFGFNSLFEYDNKIYGLYGLFSIVNRSEDVEVGFINVKSDGQTMQTILTVNTINYYENTTNNKRKRLYNSSIEFKDIPQSEIFKEKNTQDIDDETISSTPNGTCFKTVNKAYKIVDIVPHFDSKQQLGHVLETKGQQLYVCYKDNVLE